MSRRNRKIYVSEGHIVKRNARREKGMEAGGMEEKERSRERQRKGGSKRKGRKREEQRKRVEEREKGK